MEGFRQSDNALMWEGNHETVKIEPWGKDYVPEKMAAYGVSRPQLMTYDVQWRATYFLSINLPFAPTAF